MRLFCLFVLLTSLHILPSTYSVTNCKEIRGFVDGHNKVRMLVAFGEVDKQPGTSKMNGVVWDDELGKKARRRVAAFTTEHNYDTSIPTNRFTTGENVFTVNTTRGGQVMRPNIPISAWFNEHIHYQFGPLKKEHFTKGEFAIGHYTQMVWSDSVYIGCAISKTVEKKWRMFMAVCYYGPAGNVIGKTPYLKGKKSSKLTCGGKSCRKLYGYKCSPENPLSNETVVIVKT